MMAELVLSLCLMKAMKAEKPTTIGEYIDAVSYTHLTLPTTPYV